MTAGKSEIGIGDQQRGIYVSRLVGRQTGSLKLRTPTPNRARSMHQAASVGWVEKGACADDFK